jgi:hypothetical protein
LRTSWQKQKPTESIPIRQLFKTGRLFYLFCFVLFVFSSHALFALCVCAGWRQRPEKTGTDERKNKTGKKNKKSRLISFPFSAYSFVMTAVHINCAIQRWRKCNNAAGEKLLRNQAEERYYIHAKEPP